MDQLNQSPSNGHSHVDVSALPQDARVINRGGRRKGTPNSYSRKLSPELFSPVVNVEDAKNHCFQCDHLLGRAAGQCKLACERSKLKRHG